MSEFEDPQYLLADQYKDASNFAERMKALERLSKNATGWYGWLFDAINLPAGGDILELGCGPGYLWQRNLERVPANWHVTLTDFSAGMLEAARQNLQASQHEWQFEVVDAQAIPFQDETYDVVVANTMLYHVPDKQRAFAEIRRVLRPEGFFYATTIASDTVSQLGPFFSPTIGGESTESFTFSQKNGREQLAPWFESIEERSLPMAMAVTEVEPMLNLIRSVLPQAQRDEQALQKIRARLAQILQEQGTIEWSMDIVLFICSALVAKQA